MLLTQHAARQRRMAPYHCAGWLVVGSRLLFLARLEAPTAAAAQEGTYLPTGRILACPRVHRSMRTRRTRTASAPGNSHLHLFIITRIFAPCRSSCDNARTPRVEAAAQSHKDSWGSSPARVRRAPCRASLQAACCKPHRGHSFSRQQALLVPAAPRTRHPTHTSRLQIHSRMKATTQAACMRSSGKAGAVAPRCCGAGLAPAAPRPSMACAAASTSRTVAAPAAEPSLFAQLKASTFSAGVAALVLGAGAPAFADEEVATMSAPAASSSEGRRVCRRGCGVTLPAGRGRR